MLENSQDSSSNYRKKFSLSNSKSPKSNLEPREYNKINEPFNSNENEQKQAVKENKPFKARDPSTKISIFLDENMKLLLPEKESGYGKIELIETDVLGSDHSRDRIININETQKTHEELFPLLEENRSYKGVKK